MKKHLLFTVLFFSFFASSFAQRTQRGNTELTVKNGFFGWQFYRNGEKLKLTEVTHMLAPNEQAAAYLRSAKSNYTWSQIISSVGGFLVGYPLGVSAGGGTPNWTMAGIGAGLAVASIPLSSKASKQVKNAVIAYNEGARATTYRKPVFRLGITGNGAGVSMAF